MRMCVACLILLTTAVVLSAPIARDALKIYVIDVEGGKSMLVVSPSGESLLVDTGNIGDGAQRDAKRIMAAVTDAGLQRIDHLVTTHWHRDHVGAMPLIAARIPIRDFVDHGRSVQPDPPIDLFLQRTYPELYRRSTHTVVNAGDTIPIAGLDVRVVTSAGTTIHTPLPGAGTPNAECAGLTQPAIDKTENGQSIGLHITFGNFRLLDLGDLTANKEFELMCPDNRVGDVDVFMVSRHGQPGSDSQVLVHALNARVAVMNNGIRKGGQPEVMQVIHTAPGLENLWQLHFSQLSGQEYTVPGLFIANLADSPQFAMPIAPMRVAKNGIRAPKAPTHNGPANWIILSARRDGSFSMTNSRNGFSKSYHARASAPLRLSYDR